MVNKITGLCNRYILEDRRKTEEARKKHAEYMEKQRGKRL